MEETMEYSINSCRSAVTTPTSKKKAGKRRKGRKRTRATGDGSVQERVRTLQRLIPGGRGLQPDRLFTRTADYILHLKRQVHVLQALSKIYQPGS